MEHAPDSSAAVTVALALAAGMLAQVLARHLRLPGIVLLLGAGVVLGPDLLGVVNPHALGESLHVLVGFAVAVILFEGGMNLDLRRLRREAAVIRRLLTWGALVTAIGATLVARWAMGWDWPPAVAFGSLVIVTGPTVITPLLRRIKVKHTVATVLEAEGVLIDAIGAVLASVVLQVLLASASLEGAIAEGALNAAARLGFGLLLGVAGGWVLALLLRVRHVVPEGLENVFTLSLVLALFQLSNAALPESGIMTVTAAGMVVGNARTHVQRDLLEFKEQLTVMLIGMLFVLLAADVRLADVRNLGWPAVVTVAALMFVVRPLNIAVSAFGSSLTARERMFCAWLAPRGVVAAAVASLFAQSFPAAGIEGGRELQALVFLVIASTVLVQGLSGGFVARLLDLRRPAHRGFAIVGANELGHTLGRLLRAGGEEVLFVDSNPSACRVVEADGFRVVYGNVLQERTQQRAQLEDRSAVIAATANDEVNLLIARNAVEDFKVPQVVVAVSRYQNQVTPQVVRAAGGRVLFGVPRDLELWAVRLRREIVAMETWRWKAEGVEPENVASQFPRLVVLPLAAHRKQGVVPFDDSYVPHMDDRVDFGILTEKLEEGRSWLAANGWEFVGPVEDPAPDETVSGSSPDRASTG